MRYSKAQVKRLRTLFHQLCGHTNTEIQDYSYDPVKAKQLLKEAGYENGFDTNIWAMPVQRPYNPNARRMAEIMQEDWKKVGVNAEIVSYEWGEYLNRSKKGEHETVLLGWTGDNGDPDKLPICVVRL